jgi:5'-nucleotidase
MQFGGCHPTGRLPFRSSFKGANFPFLGANVTFTNGFPALLPFSIQYSGDVPIGVIGATLKDLPQVVTPEAIKGLKIGDEVKAINRTADILDSLGVKAQVVLLHQGDNSRGGPDDCRVVAGPATAIAQSVTPKVDAIFTGHSHQQYNCQIADPSGAPRTLSRCFVRAASLGGRSQDQPEDPRRRTRPDAGAQRNRHARRPARSGRREAG